MSNSVAGRPPTTGKHMFGRCTADRCVEVNTAVPGAVAQPNRSSIFFGRRSRLLVRHTFNRGHPLNSFSYAPSIQFAIMLNALSRAALGALKAGKSNLTPKIVHNELPKAMVATTSTGEYDARPRAAIRFFSPRRRRIWLRPL